jgi:hypothetical protein
MFTDVMKIGELLYCILVILATIGSRTLCLLVRCQT